MAREDLSVGMMRHLHGLDPKIADPQHDPSCKTQFGCGVSVSRDTGQMYYGCASDATLAIVHKLEASEPYDIKSWDQLRRQTLADLVSLDTTNAHGGQACAAKWLRRMMSLHKTLDVVDPKLDHMIGFTAWIQIQGYRHFGPAFYICIRESMDPTSSRRIYLDNPVECLGDVLISGGRLIECLLEQTLSGAGSTAPTAPHVHT